MTSKSSNKNLHKANRAKNDEFYTQIADIEKELMHYKEHFKNKVVYCNCDDPFESNFFKYFAANFNALNLKKILATSYNKSPIAGRQVPLFEMEGLKSIKPIDAESHKIEINEVYDINRDGAINLDDVAQLIRHGKNTTTPLVGNGDFRSDECIELLKQADIVVTNPPFSLFREYVAQLVEYDKKFIIIGNQNAITYKEIFRLIKDNKIWLGYGFTGGAAHFINKHYQDYATAGNHKEGMIRVSGVVWFTNLEIKKRYEDLILYKIYKGNGSDYPKYDNYDAINIDITKNIPADYAGAMGVPITFLDKFNPDQFEILGNLGSYAPDGYSLSSAIFINGKKIFKRILIRNKKIAK